MSDFSFTSTAECNYCGNLLSSSDQECGECSEDDISQHVFRRLTSSGDTPEKIVIESTKGHKWYKLEQEVGDDWIAYEWLGPRTSVQKMIGTHMWETLQDIPRRAMSTDAPSDVGES